MGKGRLPCIEMPHQLKSLSHQQLLDLAEEIRARIIGVVAENGGHLAPSLGVVELAIALHYVFDAGYDRFIWDVGIRLCTQAFDRAPKGIWLPAPVRRNKWFPEALREQV